MIASLDLGGLGHGSFRAKNLGLLGKWHWRTKIDIDVVWHEVISSLYGSNSGLDEVFGSGLAKWVWYNIRNCSTDIYALGILFHHYFKTKCGRGLS